MFISIIIPTYNEAEHIANLILQLQKNNSKDYEILVVDAGSLDDTQNIAKKSGVQVLESPVKGRSKQMNFAAKHSKGDVLYFVHADTLPPLSFFEDIKQSIAEGFQIGCFRFKFNSDKTMLKLNSYFTRFDRLMCRGGDQSLFITRKLFDELNGYCEQHKVMEDYDIIIRARKKYAFKIIPKNVLVSARKYDYNSYLKVNIANLTAFMMFYAKADHDRIIKVYKKLLNHEKSELKY
ncbi:TIGR04283 family arsenosugar biosynthesis glycosyltransferase [Pedobacter cryophilus]|uniref:Glycosyltransferase n=1 Tax=Pedobacter cryophilus TaxID=2571271 RepID=A0A4U1BY70_9SPHI|nr:TIGR04283 family arsenosugar biosynthesis glycosyltransferase [Pedobacter cryophilus]TKB97725.1 glycosyltransferase [Pedobacter cryophilus]